MSLLTLLKFARSLSHTETHALALHVMVDRIESLVDTHDAHLKGLSQESKRLEASLTDLAKAKDRAEENNASLEERLQIFSSHFHHELSLDDMAGSSSTKP